MRGGRERWSFFRNQSTGFLAEHSANLPESGYTEEEEEAGFKRLNETFEFYATLDLLTGGDILKQNAVMKMPVREVYFKIRYMAWRSHIEKEYRRIMTQKEK